MYGSMGRRVVVGHSFLKKEIHMNFRAKIIFQHLISKCANTEKNFGVDFLVNFGAKIQSGFFG